MSSIVTTESLLERSVSGIEQGLVPAAIFNDEGIFRLEKERIFSKCWIYIGHESELTNPGDYFLRRVVDDSFIFLRDSDSKIRIFFNSCRHRGSTVCRTDQGNTSRFRCPYHGWTYANSGQLVAVPSREVSYSKLQLDNWGLIEPAKIDSYQGLWFINLDPNSIELSEYLGEFRWYLDMQFALSGGGMDVIGPPHRWRINSDWKSSAENFTGDSSHTQMTHGSVLRLGLTLQAAAGPVGTAHGIHVNDCDGHAISLRLIPDGKTYLGYPEEIQGLINQSHLSREQISILAQSVVQDGTVFPNLSFIHMAGTISPQSDENGFLALRVWQPLGPGVSEVWNWVLVPKESSPEYRRVAYRTALATFSPSGNFEQDDTNIWAGIAKTAASMTARLQHMVFNYQMGMPGMSDVVPISDWPGPGAAWPSNAGESGLRSFHQRWIGQMTDAGSDE